MVGVNPMTSTTVKEAARRLVDRLPDTSTWDDLMHEIYVRQAIESGLADSEAGRTRSVEEVRREFNLSH
jgi:predicted transcriptional regulator